METEVQEVWSEISVVMKGVLGFFTFNCNQKNSYFSVLIPPFFTELN
jgi:hypothetical protein